MYITIKIEILYLIKDHYNYGFGADKNLYNLQRCRKLYNNGSIGYVINNKFISLKKIRPLLYKPEKNKIPF